MRLLGCQTKDAVLAKDAALTSVKVFIYQFFCATEEYFQLNVIGLISVLFLCISVNAAQTNLVDFSPVNTSVKKEDINLSAVENTDTVLQSLGLLESSRDPKCHATATRLESLIYGTPLSDVARYRKTEYQKQFILAVWAASTNLLNNTDSLVGRLDIKRVSSNWLTISQSQGSSAVKVVFAGTTLNLSAQDIDHYGSIAYSLRAILGVQQDQFLLPASSLPQLSADAVDELKNLTDMVTLAVLQLADRSARAQDRYDVSVAMIDDAWLTLFPEQNISVQKHDVHNQQTQTDNKPSKNRVTGTLSKIIEQKIQSYKKYNHINGQLFARNLQVYFSYAKLPKDQRTKEAFKLAFTQSMVGFASSLYEQAQHFSQNSPLISESAVQLALDKILPHKVNSYEDVIFFPRYPKKQQVVVESYDLDAFRDSGLHWQYLANALQLQGTQYVKEADPFAAELLAEGIAHFGLLLLRKTGEFATQKQGKTEATLNAEYVIAAQQNLQAAVNAYLTYQAAPVVEEKIVSSTLSQQQYGTYFDRVDKEFALNVEHRSSDWLSRQMRSYIKVGEVGNITIPPAFGGAGVAAEDINGDGLSDLLILSGSGNKLLLNVEGKFVDITASAGLNWQRKEDGLPGEPRQPLIADLDNDGLQDIIITYVNDTHRVYKNMGDGTFDDKTADAQLGGKQLVAGPATLVDINNDGLLDIYVVYFGNYLQGILPTLARKNDNGTENQLFINKGNFTFERTDGALGAANTGWGQAVTHTDVNQDGWQDLIVGNDFGVNAYYINRKGKELVNVANELGTDKPSYTMNISLTDLNQDGFPDVYISNIITMNKDERYVLPSKDTAAIFNPNKLANMRVVESNDLFMSAKIDGRLAYRLSDQIGRGDTSTGWAWDADFFDVDNDGDEDLYVVNGMNDYFVYSTKNAYESEEVIFPDAGKASNVFYLNEGGRLTNKSQPSGLDIVANSRSVAYLDLENDGDLDVVVNNYHDSAMLFRNNANKLDNNWLKIKLVGAPKNGVNLDAIGAQILVGFGDSGYAWRQVSSSQGYMSVHPKTQHIGLGKEKSARIMVIWPNGQRESFGVLEGNQSYLLNYGSQ